MDELREYAILYTQTAEEDILSKAEYIEERNACQGRRRSRRSSEHRVSGAQTLDLRAGFCYSGILSPKKMAN